MSYSTTRSSSIYSSMSMSSTSDVEGLFVTLCSFSSTRLAILVHLCMASTDVRIAMTSSAPLVKVSAAQPWSTQIARHGFLHAFLPLSEDASVSCWPAPNVVGRDSASRPSVPPSVRLHRSLLTGFQLSGRCSLPDAIRDVRNKTHAPSSVHRREVIVPIRFSTLLSTS